MKVLFGALKKYGQQCIPTPFYIFTSIVEMILTLAIIHVPIILRIIYLKFDPKFSDSSFYDLFIGGFKYGDVLGYTAGLLASSTVWFLLNIGLFKSRPLRVVLMILAPLLLLFFAAPVYFKEMNGELNSGFAASYVQGIVVLSFFFWFVSLYQQKAIVNISSVSGSQMVDSIVEQVRKPQ